jgi:formiminotetrahydrofolate cyclodeaminase
MLEAGRHYLRKQERSLGVSDAELIKIAVKSMGLDELVRIQPRREDHRVRDARRTTSRSASSTCPSPTSCGRPPANPRPPAADRRRGGGAFGAALGTMVANLSSHKRGWDDRWEEYSDWAVKGKACHDELLRLIDATPTPSTNVMAAFGCPRATRRRRPPSRPRSRKPRSNAISAAPHVMEVALESMEVAMKAMAESGLEASVSDAGVAALCARSAVMGAYLNVKINAKRPRRQERRAANPRPGRLDPKGRHRTVKKSREAQSCGFGVPLAPSNRRRIYRFVEDSRRRWGVEDAALSPGDIFNGLLWLSLLPVKTRIGKSRPLGAAPALVTRRSRKQAPTRDGRNKSRPDLPIALSLLRLCRAGEGGRLRAGIQRLRRCTVSGVRLRDLRRIPRKQSLSKVTTPDRRKMGFEQHISNQSAGSDRGCLCLAMHSPPP